jgi:hypothetical protein
MYLVGGLHLNDGLNHSNDAVTHLDNVLRHPDDAVKRRDDAFRHYNGGVKHRDDAVTPLLFPRWRLVCAKNEYPT